MGVIPLGSIRLDGGTQPREQIDLFTVEEYAQAMRDGATFPPAEVVYDGESYWLWDGFHRYQGASLAGLVVIACNVREGTVEDARWLALAANKTHGLRRTPADKRRAVEQALSHPHSAALSDAQVADHCGVSREFVCRVRPTCDRSQVESRTGRDGRTINTANIGKSNGTAYQPPDDEPEEAGPGLFNGPDEDDDDPGDEDAPDDPLSGLFVCPCGESFDRQVWHCPICSHHWLMHQDECRNCYVGEQDRAYVAKPLSDDDDEDQDEGQGDEESQPIQRPVLVTPNDPPEFVKPPPRYPHSDRLRKWLMMVMADTQVIRVEMGGIRSLLAERDRWDWTLVREYIRPMLDALGQTIDEFKKEIDHAAE
jgi:hypothetical protein